MARAITSEEAMQVEIIDKERHPKKAGSKLSFRLRNVDNAFANALRRVMLAEIPTLAIEWVDIRTNTSVYHDEMLAHRIGLVPLKSQRARDKNYHRDCGCDDNGCPNCQIVMSLHVRCDSREHSRVVTTKDLLHDDPSTADVSPVSATEEGIWLLTLGRGQEVDIRCKVRKGIAKMHTRYMCVGTVAMQYDMDIRLNKTGLSKLNDETRKLWVSKCPTEVFAYNEVDGSVDTVNANACINCRECLTLEPPFDKLPASLVAVRQQRNSAGKFSVVYHIEATGVLEPEQIIRDAIAVVLGKLRKVKTGLNEEERPGQATRPISRAPTAVRVADQEEVQRPQDDDLAALLGQ